jgi:hypothetical protein
MNAEINYYRKKVEYYFESEYSDLTIEESIDKILSVENKSKKYWLRKVEKITYLYCSINKNPQDAAAFIAKLFRPRLKFLINPLTKEI